MSSASVDTIWKSILEEIRQESPILHVLLDKNVRPYVVNSTLYLETKNSWSLQKLSQTRFRSKLDDVVRKHFNTSYSIEFVLASTTAPREDPTAGSTDEERATSLLSTPEIQNHGEVTNSSNPATITDTIRALLTHTGEEGVILVLESLIEHIKSSSTDTELAPVNQSVLTKTNIIEHDNLVFRSYSEICVYNVLKERSILFLVNSPAILGGKNQRRELNFLMCQNGKWGVLEVMEEPFHTSAIKDHDRARLFKTYGLTCIEFYDATLCRNAPNEVVDEFLSILAKS